MEEANDYLLPSNLSSSGMKRNGVNKIYKNAIKPYNYGNSCTMKVKWEYQVNF